MQPNNEVYLKVIPMESYVLLPCIKISVFITGGIEILPMLPHFFKKSVIGNLISYTLYILIYLNEVLKTYNGTWCLKEFD